MPVLKIYKYPDAVLKNKAEPVAEVSDEIRQLIDDMFETMYAAPGIGLAATQVGVSKRVIVIDISHSHPEIPPLALVNPVITFKDGEICEEEGCLSVPDYQADVCRFNHVKVKALDRDGNEVEVEGEELLARAIQHEIDHLDGVLFIDRISALKREMYKRRVKKLMKREEVNL
ncbi:MAG: peptide deformylase [Nitrospirota bacterium]|nr:peptide deformylase [Nitrospirota bacterium]